MMSWRTFFAFSVLTFFLEALCALYYIGQGEPYPLRTVGTLCLVVLTNGMAGVWGLMIFVREVSQK